MSTDDIRPSRNRRLSIARAWMHEKVCTSKCGGDNDHARSTQHNFARNAVAATTLPELTRAIHDGSCLNGDRCDTDAHLNHIEPIAAELWTQLGGGTA